MKSLPASLDLLPSDPAVVALAVDYPHGHLIPPHSHARAQLLFAVEGVMTVEAEGGRWVVPPVRAIWLQAGVVHQVRMSGDVRMRTVFVDGAGSPLLPERNCVLDIPPLLRELIVAAVNLAPDYATGSRDWHLAQLLLRELRAVPVLPLYLPMPAEPRLRAVCASLMAAPAEQLSVAAWARQLGIATRTLHRQFLLQTGMQFGAWRQQARLLLALEQLARGAKVIDVALEHGYSSQSAFTAMFKQHFGCTPGAFYRRSTR